jgi:hypothetical protein
LYFANWGRQPNSNAFNCHSILGRLILVKNEKR